MLLCDFGNLADEVRRLEEAGAAALHLDVMDGHFVDNLTYGLTIVEATRRVTSLPLDVHLMISNPGRYIARYCEAGADLLTIHSEATDDPQTLLREIRQHDVAAGLAINPGTPVSDIEHCLDSCDMALAMSVEPGFGGQAFDSVALDKLRQLKGLVAGDVLLEVDGGVNDETIGRCAEAGADLFVAGSAIFNSDDYTARLARLRQLASKPD